MIWKRDKEILHGHADSPDIPYIPWIEPAENPWGVRLLDVRPVTLNMLSSSADRQCAANAGSFHLDDGTSFIGQEPPISRRIEANLRFPTDRILVDGVLFMPREMENKWALFYHQGYIICVRSWLRSVQAVARVEPSENHVVITEIQGAFTAEEEDASLTIRTLDYLLWSHALGVAYPAPLPAGVEKEPSKAAIWCMSIFGNLAWFATPEEFDRPDPEEPLRTISLLHIAVASGDISAVEACLAAGTPVDLLAKGGMAPLHWALANDNPSIMTLLLDRGSPVDVRSDEGATPLMNAVQDNKIEKALFLFDHGADPDARDRRGFTSLHRAAEMGHLDMLRVLLERGASPNPEAQGHTPRSLAEARGQKEIVALLDSQE